MLRRGLFHAFRIVLTVGLLFYLIRRIGTDSLARLIHDVDPRYLLAVVGLIGLDVILRAYNWGLLLRCLKVRVSLGLLLYGYLVGGFFGTFVPSSLGVDLARLVVLGRKSSMKLENSASSLVMLNVVGVAALALMALGGAIALLVLGTERALVLTVIGASVAVLATLIVAVTSQRLIARLLARWREIRVLSRLQSFAAAFREFQRYPRTLVISLGIALVNQLLAASIAFTIARALQAETAFGYFVALMPIVTLTRLIPISVAGLGAEQGIFVYLFGRVGLPAGQAFVVSLLLSTANLVFTLFGGLVYVVEPLVRPGERRR